MKKKQLWKRVVAVGLATALILSTGMLGGKQGNVAKAETTNLVTNGDFDSDESTKDVAGWTPGEPEVEKEIVPTDICDEASLTWSGVSGVSNRGSVEYADGIVTLSATQGNYEVRSSAFTITTETAYTITYDVKLESASSAALTPKIYYYSDGSQLITGTKQQMNTDGEWHTMQFYAESGTVASSSTSWQLQFAVSAAVDVSIKNIKVTYDAVVGDKIEEIDAGVQNGNFENGLTNWQNNKGEVVEDSQRGGSVLKIPATGTANSRNITVKENTTYKFMCYIKTEGTDARNRVALQQRYLENGSYTTIVNRNYIANEENLGEWTLIQDEFTTAEGVNSLEIYLLASGNSEGYAYYDDVTLVELAPVYGDGVTLNGDNYAMKLSENNSATYDGASLVANTWYRFSYNVSADDNVTSAGFKVGDTIKTSTSGVFQYVDGQAIGFATEGTGVAYFDNLVIEPLSITMQANATYIMTVAQTLTGEGTVAPVVQNDTMTADVQAITTDTSKYVITPKGEGIYTISFTIGDGVTIDNATSILNRGDFDFDGELEEAEFTAIRKELVGVTDTGFDSQMMDLDADSENTVKDLVRMKLYGAGLK